MQNIHASIASMISRMRQLEITANNLSNVNTPGFKQARYFSNILDDLINRNPEQGIYNGQLRLEERQKIDLSQGILEKTDNPLDFGLDGEGFFVVQGAQGEEYTRNGKFSRDASGYLVTSNGTQVLGESGPIVLPEGSVEVSKSGDIMVDGLPIDRFRIVQVADPDQITRLGNSQLTFPAIEDGIDSGTIHQGYLEMSNAEPIESMNEIISLQREFESNQRMLRTLDEMDRLASNDVGRI